MSSQVRARRAERQRGVEHPFLLPQMICQVLNLRCRRTDQDHLRTEIVVQMYMRGNKDGVIVIVLEFDELFAELADMVIVHQGDRAEGFLLTTLPFVGDQDISDHIAHKFRAIRVALLVHEPFDALQERLRQRQAESHEIDHDGLLP